MGFRLLPKGIEEAVFKPVPEGWLFTTASPWILAPRRTYLVSDAQKLALAVRVRWARYARLAALLLEVPVWIAALSFFQYSALTYWLTLLAASLFSGVLFAIIDHLSVRSLIRDLPRSTQRIRAVERWKTQSRSMSVRKLAIFTALELSGALVMGGMAYEQKNVSSAMTTALFLSCGLYFGALLLWKLRIETVVGRKKAR